MFNFIVDNAWVKVLKNFVTELPGKLRLITSSALNAVGEDATREYTELLSQHTGLDPAAVKSLLVVKPATPEDLSYGVDASSVAVPPSLDWSRPWDTRDSTYFQTKELVELVTMNDERVCPICTSVKDNNPYSMDELDNLRVHGYHGENGIVHYGCRCMLKTWASQRSLPVTFGKGSGNEMPSGLMNMRTIGSRIVAELRTLIKK